MALYTKLDLNYVTDCSVCPKVCSPCAKINKKPGIAVINPGLKYIADTAAGGWLLFGAPC